MEFVIVTGMSGAGKSTVLKMLEDMGYFCMDNLPVFLLSKLGELDQIAEQDIEKIALGVDIRGWKSFERLDHILEDWDAQGVQYKILYLDADTDVLIRRYKETRRMHPLGNQTRMENVIEEERSRLEKLKEKSTYIIDTGNLLVRELKQEIEKIFVDNQEYKNLYITVLSFGFKNGIPRDADLVFDVRFLPNPYYHKELKAFSGNDEPVKNFVMDNPKAQEFFYKLADMIEFLIPNYVAEGKNDLVIAIGCTGGKHRSVTIANELYDALGKKEGYGIRVEHRDIQRENRIKNIGNGAK